MLRIVLFLATNLAVLFMAAIAMAVLTALGIIPPDAVLESIQTEASEDFAAAVGAGPEETVYSPVTESVRSRSPPVALNR